MTFTTTVSVYGPGEGGVTSGTVTFFDNGNPLGTAQVLSGTNTTTLTTSSESERGLAFDHGIVQWRRRGLCGQRHVGGGAADGGGGEHDDDGDDAHGHDDPSVYGQSVTFTATVTVNGPGSGTVTSGTVTFYDNGSLLGTPQVLSGTNTATLTTSSLSVTGAAAFQTITASYSGDGVDFAASGTSAAVHQTVVEANTTTTVAYLSRICRRVRPECDLHGHGRRLSPGAGTATGTVTFMDGGVSIGTGALTPTPLPGGEGQNDTATLSAPGSVIDGVGLHTITAVYSCDTNFRPAAAAMLGRRSPRQARRRP